MSYYLLENILKIQIKINYVTRVFILNNRYLLDYKKLQLKNDFRPLIYNKIAAIIFLIIINDNTSSKS
ncbi:hypothetical protein BpHYR1_049293 [Brachionus plicatilis]|uniref:Uncharacterized protein n=1 Tax=Brachionus plicatilis TaxID=10195 RepID=A0A3M7P5A1_BRAPC|nr:hypothetical protein BpHYR1_049293 [Brachionus plicatilis]